MLSDIFINILIITAKALVAVLCFLLPLAAINSWFERKVSALIQDRVGANRSNIFGFDLAGIINTVLADPVKAFLKEDLIPQGVNKILHTLAPILAALPVFMCVAVIPFGPPFEILGRTITMQVANLNVALLYIFAMGGLAIYGVILAGWVSNNKFSLLGSLRAVAQMMSYEVTLGLSVVGLICIYKTLDLNKIVLLQGGSFYGLPAWGIFLNPIAFFVFFAAAMAETRRAPFDVAEGESEIVAGYFTEYSGMKFILFWLGEFAEIVIVSALIVLLFFGGWQVPYFDITTIPSDLWGVLPEWFNEVEFNWTPLVAWSVFIAKVIFFCVLQIVIRWTLPRFRYDQVMGLCWKILLTVSILNFLLTVGLVLGGSYKI
ncbi:MAG: NADH-quinone oxidoreductase subunit H [Deltaproteobacteria bacterium]|jgi:NADH-quinone oxidoreductase subunit H|nr:NADH-quinone oxidoreductase subunit H [Deltaproteobacteria bacterium]